MRAIVCRVLAEDISGVRLEEVPNASPGPGEAQIAVRAAGVNFPDILMLQGRYQFRPQPPFTPGMEAAGVVIAVGDGVTHLAPGDHVIAGVRSGAFAERLTTDAAAFRPMPSRLTFSAAAAYSTAYLTAQVALFRRGALRPGETLLVHGAAGGVGMAAVDLALATGVRVVATATGEEKQAFLRTRGAHLVLSPSDFGDAVKSFTGGRGADVIYDPVGGDVFDASVRCIAFGGRLLVVGFASGRIPSIGANMPLIKGFSLVGVRAGEHGRRNPDLRREDVERVDRLVGEGFIRPHFCATFPLDQAVAAMQMLASRKAIGKVVIVP